MKNKVFITTAIDYTNDVIHIGHAYQKILADCVARFYREKIGKENVLLLTGTDEYGQKVYNCVKKEGRQLKDFVDEISLADKIQQDALNISYDRFIRTTDPDHEAEAKDFFAKSYNNGYIYKGIYKGLYCEGCEEFLKEKDLVDEKCEYHPTRDIQVIEDENYFFKWTEFKDFLTNLFEQNKKFVLPESRYKEMKAFIDGIEDIPVTRRKERLPWGIETTVDSDHVLWVWFDALINYLTFGKEKGFWDNTTKIIHFLGKDNARMHALLWPAMLESAGYRVPTTIYVNAFLSLNGKKISKSLGNIIRPSDLVEKYGVDVIRYYLLRYGPILEDADFSEDRLKEVYNADLANGLGNLIARVAKLCDKWGLALENKSTGRDVGGSALWNGDWAKPIDEFRVDLILQNIWEQIKSVDKHINENEPWKITEEVKAREVLTWEAGQVLEIGKKLISFMPATSKKIINQFLTQPIKSETSLFPRLC
ncbi:methionine--tRNA ligase [candidate division WWE3 bacterium CG08_land_8_20_14_0_20_41_10]|uniref:methionine--tRNA ligase n=1 Tax=candidate division WWE3 bacterium CG08_land_8_20_14_0_20_41_10 TaxID=1975085 RepID=A0A2H0XCR5_UNCKA|nr:MAG: methionine--tRNA ligase [candidate division WWE3 bacterium CG08_land_8_20_14_0_20_41_10]